MADFTNLKDEIKSKIKSNGKQEITGAVLQQTMLEMIDETDRELTELSAETDKRLAESEKNTGEQIKAFENKTNNKFAGVETELENLKKGEAYVIEESLVFRNYATAQIIGNTLTL